MFLHTKAPMILLLLNDVNLPTMRKMRGKHAYGATLKSQNLYRRVLK